MQRWEQTFELAPGGGVSVDQSNGQVRVTGWDETSVKVTASSEAENLEERLHFATDNGGLGIAVQRPSNGFFGFLRSDPPVHLELMVPRGTACAVDAGSGNVEITGTRASVQVDTGSGHVAVSEASGEVRIDVGSGDVLLEKLTGDVHAETGSGKVSVANVEGSVNLETGSGSVSVLRVQGRELAIETGSGAIRAGGIEVAALSLETGSGRVEAELIQIHPTGSYRVETGSGRVQVAVPSHAGLHVDLRSDSGRITREGLELRIIRTDKGELEADLNGGGARLSVETGSGGISLVPAGA